MNKKRTPFEDGVLTPQEKKEIRKLMFQRVTSPNRRAKILRVASALGDPFEQDTDYWAAIYYYSLSENWVELDQMNSMFGMNTPDKDPSNEELFSKPPKKTKRRS